MLRTVVHSNVYIDILVRDQLVNDDSSDRGDLQARSGARSSELRSKSKYPMSESVSERLSIVGARRCVEEADEAAISHTVHLNHL